MIGCYTQSKGYKIRDLEFSKLFVSRDVIFNESSVDPLQVHVPTNAVTDSNAATTERERYNNVNNNIEMSSYMSEESKESKESEELESTKTWKIPTKPKMKTVKMSL